MDKLDNKNSEVVVVAKPCRDGKCGFAVASMIYLSLGTPENARRIIATEQAKNIAVTYGEV